MDKRLKSFITDDMQHCYFTGTPYCQIHHIFYGSRRRISEKYDFVVPLSEELHATVHNHPNTGLDTYLKQTAQTYYEEHHGTRDDFRMTFGKSWI